MKRFLSLLATVCLLAIGLQASNVQPIHKDLNIAGFNSAMLMKQSKDRLNSSKRIITSDPATSDDGKKWYLEVNNLGHLVDYISFSDENGVEYKLTFEELPLYLIKLWLYENDLNSQLPFYLCWPSNFYINGNAETDDMYDIVSLNRLAGETNICKTFKVCNGIFDGYPSGKWEYFTILPFLGQEDEVRLNNTNISYSFDLSTRLYLSNFISENTTDKISMNYNIPYELNEKGYVLNNTFEGNVFSNIITVDPGSFEDLYIIGNNVNGQMWTLSQEDAKMTYLGNNVYQWHGQTLGSGFKINNGSWDGPYNIGAASSDDFLELGKHWVYYNNNGNSYNIEFEDGGEISNPVVTLNLDAGTLKVTGDYMADKDLEIYIIGDNVNGHNWSLSEDDCKLTDLGNGTYEWYGEYLGTSFKFNDGTWSGRVDIGATSSGDNIVLDSEWYYYDGPNSQNIGLGGAEGIKNPHVILNYSEGWIRLSGETVGTTAEWYFIIENDYSGQYSHPFTYDPTTENYVVDNIRFNGETSFKVANYGLADQYGSFDGIIISEDKLSAYLWRGSTVPYAQLDLHGYYKIEVSADLGHSTEPMIAFTKLSDIVYEGPYGAPADNSLITSGKVSWLAPIFLNQDNIESISQSGASVSDATPDPDKGRNLYIWESTFDAYEFPEDNGIVSSDGISLIVGNLGWSGACSNIANNDPIDLSKINDDTHFHISFCSPDGNAPASIALILLDNSDPNIPTAPARVALGQPFEDNGKTYPSLASTITNDWQAIDITIGEIKRLCPDFNPQSLSNFSGNILSFLGGGVQGTTLALANAYFYNTDQNVNPPTPIPGTPCKVNIGIEDYMTLHLNSKVGDNFEMNFDLDEYWRIESVTTDVSALECYYNDDTITVNDIPGNLNINIKNAYKGYLEIVSIGSGITEVNDNIKVYVSADKKIHILGAPINEEVVVYSLGGQIIRKGTVTSSTETIIETDGGIFVVRIGDSAFKVII